MPGSTKKKQLVIRMAVSRPRISREEMSKVLETEYARQFKAYIQGGCEDDSAMDAIDSVAKRLDIPLLKDYRT